ncbi:MAG: hypothetical protein JWQ97_980 [Phenylobacterium sp.]|nr:hypothetical protein [Phenylobacterium sp.]
MTDLAKTIAPKSDQLNSDDLIAGPLTITITTVRGCDEPEQPVAVHFEGDDKKPYKPCKSMRRVMVHCWGPDGKTYAGRRITLFRDEGVQFGGIKVGGIRISHMSHIDRDVTMALTATRAKRTPFTVKPLQAEVVQRAAAVRPTATGEELTLSQRADAYEKRIREAPSTVKLKAIRAAGEKLRSELDLGDPERLVEIEGLWNEHYAGLEAAEKAGE